MTWQQQQSARRSHKFQLKEQSSVKLAYKTRGWASAQAPEGPPAEVAQLAAGTLLPVGDWIGLLSADVYRDLGKSC